MTSIGLEALSSAEEFEVYANAAAASGVNFETLHGTRPTALYSPVDGTLIVTKFSGDSETLTFVAGGFIPVGVQAITGGTATNFAVFWSQD